jgi:hypothetical protein
MKKDVPNAQKWPARDRMALKMSATAKRTSARMSVARPPTPDVV